MKYKITVWALSGGWRDKPAGKTFKEAVESAYHAAQLSHVRSVSVNRTLRNGCIIVAATVAGYEGRVWLSRNCGLNELKWRGVIPTEGNGVKEITNRFAAIPPSYQI